MKLLATDYDGTIKFAGQVLEEDLQAIQNWKDQDHLFALITARSPQSIFDEIDKYNIPFDFVVSNNGCLIFDQDRRLLNSTRLDATTALDLMYAAHELPEVVSYAAVSENGRFKVTVNPNLEDYHYGHLEDADEAWLMENYAGFVQLIYSMQNEDEATQLAEKVNQHFSNSVHAYAINTAVYMVPASVNKGMGLEFITAFGDVDDDEVYVLGDNFNDLSMLENAQNSAAMASAPGEVINNVNEVYPSIQAFIEEILTR